MTNQESNLSKSIYQNMQLKDSDELIKIWIKNDRSEWSDEAFLIIYDILLKRLGSVPQQSSENPKRRRNRKIKEKNKLPLSIIIIFLPGVIVLVLIGLIPLIDPGPNDKWFTFLMLMSLSLFFFIPGIYFGWKSFFQSEELKKSAVNNLPNTKRLAGVFYYIYTYFLPDRFVPIYILYSTRFMSILLIYGGIKMIMLLILTI